MLAETDVAPPDFEKLSVKVRGPGVINVLPGNIVGTADAVITLHFTVA